MTSWTTKGLHPDRQFSYWREILCEAYVALHPRRVTEGPCPSYVLAHAISEINVTTVASKAQVVGRGPAEIRQTSRDFLFVNLQVEGTCRVVEGARETRVGPGEFAIVDSTRPYQLDFSSGDWKVHSLRLPRHLLLPRLRKPERATAIRIGPEQAAGAVSIDFMTSLAARASTFPDKAATTLSSTLVDLLALALDDGDDTAEAGRDTLRRELSACVIRHIGTHAADPSMSVGRCAKQFRMSVRSLQRLLHDHGHSFERVLLETRLAHCARDLSDARQPRSISEIAYRWGFSDLSHFSRSFKARYSATPREFRADARLAQDPIPDLAGRSPSALGRTGQR